MVSGKRRRTVEGNVNLDLTYITPQIIAMSYPSEGMESLYRNPIERVRENFDIIFVRFKNFWMSDTAKSIGLLILQRGRPTTRASLDSEWLTITGLIIMVHPSTLFLRLHREHSNGLPVTRITSLLSTVTRVRVGQEPQFAPYSCIWDTVTRWMTALDSITTRDSWQAKVCRSLASWGMFTTLRVFTKNK